MIEVNPANDLVSIIMPVYNAELYIKEAIQSVINQEYSNWELIIVNDGSSDSSKMVIHEFQDTRIKYHEQENKGVSAARNLGLSNSKGDFFCFLDADDIYTLQSISARLKVFEEDTSLTFVDGRVQYVNEKSDFIEKVYQPDFKGEPFNELLRLNEKCLFGPSWMIKKETDIVYRFDESMTHAEDLNFYLSISEGKKYSYTDECILHYRVSSLSAMSNLKGLENGYVKLIDNIKNKLSVETKKVLFLKFKVAKIMVLSHLFNGKDIFSALKAPFRILFI